MNFFSIEFTAFMLMDNPVSWLELISTILNLTAVILMARRSILTYPVGIVSSILTAILLYQFYLYSNLVEYAYYVGANVYGWVLWKSAPKDQTSHVAVTFSSRKSILKTISAMVVITILVGILMSQIHHILPKLFPEPAAFPFPDAFTTVFAFFAMWAQIKRRIESWIYWIIIDVAYITLYYLKDLNLYALLSVIYLFIAVAGLKSWLASRQIEEVIA